MREDELNKNRSKNNGNIREKVLLNIPKVLNKEMEGLSEKYELNVDLRNETWNSFYLKTGKILPDLLKNEDDKEILLNFASYIDENFEEFFLNPYDFDLNFYSEIKSKIESAYKENSEVTDEILIFSHRKISEKYNYNRVIQSILMYRDIKEEIKEILHKMPLRGYSKDIEKIIVKLQEFIEGCKEKEFKMYFFDYILKFGYLVEAYLKEIFIFYLKLCSIIDGTKNPSYKKIVNLESQNLLTIGSVFHFLDNYNSETDKEINKLRNSIFHSSFMIDYKLNFEERKFIFYDRDRVIEKSAEELILLFDYCIKIAHTFYLILPKFWGVRSLFEYILNLDSIKGPDSTL